MNNFDQTMQEMQQHRMKTPQAKQAIRVPGSVSVLREAIAYFLGLEGRKMHWLPEYEAVARWLTDNEGRGLFLYGNCGRGKSLLVRYVLPAIILQCCRKVVSVYDVREMNATPDEVMSKRLIGLDDIGTEEVINHYGNKRLAFAEIMDAVEKQNRLILVSTNLNEQQLRTMYGDRTLDRIKSTTKRVLFRGDSLRG